MSLFRLDDIQEKDVELMYLYETEGNLVFIDTNTYEEYVGSVSRFEWEKKFLITNYNYSGKVRENKVTKITLPDEIALASVECRPIESVPYKIGICETSLELTVPLYVEVGRQIKVSTIDGSYKGIVTKY